MCKDYPKTGTIRDKYIGRCAIAKKTNSKLSDKLEGHEMKCLQICPSLWSQKLTPFTLVYDSQAVLDASIFQTMMSTLEGEGEGGRSGSSRKARTVDVLDRRSIFLGKGSGESATSSYLSITIQKS